MKSLLQKPPSNTATKKATGRLAVLAALVAGTGALHADLIPVPNYSFETQSGVGQPFGVNINVDDWQKQDRPAYFPESGYNGFYWVQTAGNFLNPASGQGRVLNAAGAQAEYVLSFPGAGLFQDYTATDWAGTTHAFTATYQAGKSYELTAGIFGESVNDGAILQLSMYYRDALNSMVTVGTPNTIIYHAADFPYSAGGAFNLIDFSAEVPVVQAGDAWAGQHIGINVVVFSGDGTNQWVLDNVRLTEAPEPATLGLLAIGCGGLLLRRARARREV